MIPLLLFHSRGKFTILSSKEFSLANALIVDVFKEPGTPTKGSPS